MTEDNMPAATPAEATTQPAQQSPADDYGFQDEPAEQPADLGEMDRPKKLSGSARAKLKQEYLQNEIRQERELRQAHEQRIAELERYIHEEDGRRRSTESERQAEARRRHEAAHVDRVKAARETITDWDRVLSKMSGVNVRDDVIEEIIASDKSELIVYELARNPDKIRDLNSMNERERARELGRLEGSLRLPEGRKQTTAPPPPSHLKGGAAPATDLAKAGMDAYVAARKAQGFGKR